MAGTQHRSSFALTRHLLRSAAVLAVLLLPRAPAIDTCDRSAGPRGAADPGLALQRRGLWLALSVSGA